MRKRFPKNDNCVALPSSTIVSAIAIPRPSSPQPVPNSTPRKQTSQPQHRLLQQASSYWNGPPKHSFYTSRMRFYDHSSTATSTSKQSLRASAVTGNPSLQLSSDPVSLEDSDRARALVASLEATLESLPGKQSLSVAGSPVSLPGKQFISVAGSPASPRIRPRCESPSKVSDRRSSISSVSSMDFMFGDLSFEAPLTTLSTGGFGIHSGDSASFQCQPPFQLQSPCFAPGSPSQRSRRFDQLQRMSPSSPILT